MCGVKEGSADGASPSITLARPCARGCASPRPTGILRVNVEGNLSAGGRSRLACRPTDRRCLTEFRPYRPHAVDRCGPLLYSVVLCPGADLGAIIILFIARQFRTDPAARFGPTRHKLGHFEDPLSSRDLLSASIPRILIEDVTYSMGCE